MPAVLMEMLKSAKSKGVTVSCDLNYRKNLWTPEEAQQVMPALVEYCDVIIGTVEDSALTVGVVPETADLDLGRQTEENYFKTAQMLARRFNARKVAMMERESISSNDTCAARGHERPGSRGLWYGGGCAQAHDQRRL